MEPKASEKPADNRYTRAYLSKRESVSGMNMEQITVVGGGVVVLCVLSGAKQVINGQKENNRAKQREQQEEEDSAGLRASLEIYAK